MPNVNLARKPSTDTTVGEASFRDAFPAGVMLPYAGATAPAGWLLCDGTAINRTTYARLFAAISDTYGVGDGSTTFNLPNTQGVFLRGAGSQTISALSYSATRGVKQNDATAVKGLSSTNSTTTSGRHEHIITINDGSTPGYPLYNSGGGTGSGYFQRAGFTEAPNTASTGNTARFTKAEQNLTSMSGVSLDSAHSHSISVTSSDAETRPANVGVNYIIKI